MYNEADKLKGLLRTFDQSQLNVLLRFGQVAKYRCRSNVAYKNFVTACLDGSDYEVTNKTVVMESGKTFEGMDIIKKVIA